MAEHYGSLVGAVKQLTPFRPVDAAFENGKDTIVVRDIYTAAGATAQNDTIQAAICGWETVLDPDSCKIHFTAGGAGCTLSLGDAAHPTALDNAVDIHAAGNANLLSAVTVPNYYQPLWQALGYADLATAQKVARQCELIFTIGGAVLAAGTLVWRLVGSRRI